MFDLWGWELWRGGCLGHIPSSLVQRIAGVQVLKHSIPGHPEPFKSPQEASILWKYLPLALS